MRVARQHAGVLVSADRPHSVIVAAARDHPAQGRVAHGVLGYAAARDAGALHGTVKRRSCGPLPPDTVASFENARAFL